MIENESALAKNLRILIESNGLNITETANNLNLPLMTVRRLLSGETPNPRLSTLNIIANYFKVTIDQLICDSNIANLQNNNSRLQSVPLLTWHEASSINSIHELNLSSWKNWQNISIHKSKLLLNAFALKSRPSFHSRFPDGTVFIIDTDIIVSDGDIVLVKFIGNNELTLREIYVDQPESTLNSLTPELSPISYNPEKHKIIGVSVLTLYYNTKFLQLHE
jgi:SOS-response transcriptional repressor LexA